MYMMERVAREWPEMQFDEQTGARSIVLVFVYYSKKVKFYSDSVEAIGNCKQGTFNELSFRVTPVTIMEQRG